MDEQLNLCRICANPIPSGAKKCTECGEYQNLIWRVISGFDLKGLIALVPIVTLAFAFIQDRLERKESDLRIALVSCEQEKVNLFASNVGNRGAIIGAAHFQTNDQPPQPLTLSLELANRLINGGETRAIELTTDPQFSPGGLVPFEERGKDDCSVLITIKTIAFDNKIKLIEQKCDCPK